MITLVFFVLVDFQQSKELLSPYLEPESVFFFFLKQKTYNIGFIRSFFNYFDIHHRLKVNLYQYHTIAQHKFTSLSIMTIAKPLIISKSHLMNRRRKEKQRRKKEG